MITISAYEFVFGSFKHICNFKINLLSVFTNPNDEIHANPNKLRILADLSVRICGLLLIASNLRCSNVERREAKTRTVQNSVSVRAVFVSPSRKDASSSRPDGRTINDGYYRKRPTTVLEIWHLRTTRCVNNGKPNGQRNFSPWGARSVWKT